MKKCLIVVLQVALTVGMSSQIFGMETITLNRPTWQSPEEEETKILSTDQIIDMVVTRTEDGTFAVYILTRKKSVDSLYSFWFGNKSGAFAERNLTLGVFDASSIAVDAKYIFVGTKSGSIGVEEQVDLFSSPPFKQIIFSPNITLHQTEIYKMFASDGRLVTASKALNIRMWEIRHLIPEKLQKVEKGQKAKPPIPIYEKSNSYLLKYSDRNMVYASWFILDRMRHFFSFDKSKLEKFLTINIDFELELGGFSGTKLRSARTDKVWSGMVQKDFPINHLFPFDFVLHYRDENKKEDINYFEYTYKGKKTRMDYVYDLILCKNGNLYIDNKHRSLEVLLEHPIFFKQPECPKDIFLYFPDPPIRPGYVVFITEEKVMVKEIKNEIQFPNNPIHELLEAKVVKSARLDNVLFLLVKDNTSNLKLFCRELGGGNQAKYRWIPNK
jgi:hypothetical protein